jgi:DNA-binding NarL/FixJ family response regulator
MSAGDPSKDGAVRILIVDDHPMVRDMIRLGCEERPGLQVVGEAANGSEALEASERLHPDVVVLDLILPGIDGFEVMRRLREMDGAIRILVLTNRDDAEAALESLRLGVKGYVEKTTALEKLVDAIEAVGRGEEVFAPALERQAYARLGSLARQARTAARAAAMLSRRESDVVRLIADGLTARQIATRLRLSQRTVETHISSLYEKLGVRTRVQAVQRAATLGLVDLSAPDAHHPATTGPA